MNDIITTASSTKQVGLDPISFLAYFAHGQQQTIFTKKGDNGDNLIRASFIVSEKMPNIRKNYSSEFVKHCFIIVAEILCPKKKIEIDTIGLSWTHREHQ